MLQYIEIMNDKGGSITFDTDAPDGEVSYITQLAVSNLKRGIKDKIDKNESGLIVVKIICSRCPIE